IATLIDPNAKDVAKAGQKVQESGYDQRIAEENTNKQKYEQAAKAQGDAIEKMTELKTKDKSFYRDDIDEAEKGKAEKDSFFKARDEGKKWIEEESKLLAKVNKTEADPLLHRDVNKVLQELDKQNDEKA